MSLKETRKFLTKLIGTCIGMGMVKCFHSWLVHLNNHKLHIWFWLLITCRDLSTVHAVHVKPGSFTDVEDALWHMHDTISQIFSVYGGELGLLFVILPDKEVGDETYGFEINWLIGQMHMFFFWQSNVQFADKSEKACDKLGFVYQCCSPEDARNPSKGYLQTTAYKINDKVFFLSYIVIIVMPPPPPQQKKTHVLSLFIRL